MNIIFPILKSRRILTETQARNSSECIGCGKDNPAGCIVCWQCFKYRTDIVPLKQWNGGFAEWQVVAIPTWAVLGGE